MNLKPPNLIQRTSWSRVTDTNDVPDLNCRVGLMSFVLFLLDFKQKALFGTSQRFEKFIPQSRAVFKLYLRTRCQLKKKTDYRSASSALKFSCHGPFVNNGGNGELCIRVIRFVQLLEKRTVSPLSDAFLTPITNLHFLKRKWGPRPHFWSINNTGDQGFRIKMKTNGVLREAK